MKVGASLVTYVWLCSAFYKRNNIQVSKCLANVHSIVHRAAVSVLSSGSAGGSLNVVIIDTLELAERLVQWHLTSQDKARKLRIWCLACLTCADHQRKYKSVQRQYPEGNHRRIL